MCCLFFTPTIHSFGTREEFYRFLWTSTESLLCVAMPVSTIECPYNTLSAAVRSKPKLQWIFQNIIDVKGEINIKPKQEGGLYVWNLEGLKWQKPSDSTRCSRCSRHKICFLFWLGLVLTLIWEILKMPLLPILNRMLIFCHLLLEA